MFRDKSPKVLAGILKILDRKVASTRREWINPDNAHFRSHIKGQLDAYLEVQRIVNAERIKLEGKN